MCTVIAEADESGHVSYLCKLDFEWTAGNFRGSTLVAEGLYRGSNVDGIVSGNGQYSIIGGTHCFGGSSGTVNQITLPDSTDGDGMIFRATITLDD